MRGLEDYLKKQMKEPEDTQTRWEWLLGRLWRIAGGICYCLTRHRWNEKIQHEIVGPVLRCRICRVKWGDPEDG